MAQKIIPGGPSALDVAGKSPEEIETYRQEFDEDVTSVKDAILRQLAAGTDIGELIYLAMVDAQREVADGHTLLENRPGSWEASGLSTLMGNVQIELAAEGQ
ncbi:hypothetical protein [Arthrobacter sp. MMS18-M83]|uniref:hypothetical protein n=1 Tax=Arthrobacter sp. MMS18-M83 TaxID=2996261 RepID=UPI00227BD881|nr:hypothetical protein [Arthrobacter sp. MMS18-M83]WAH99774.1 hypothetical protein OW521_23995 [Arthrobacter sp. MMS18-M83]